VGPSASVDAVHAPDWTTSECMLTKTIASGRGSRPNSDVQNVTGVPSISFADFARELTALQDLLARRCRARRRAGSRLATCRAKWLSATSPY